MDTASRLPAVDLGATAAHAGGPLVNAAGQSGDLFTTRATASWELDLLGRLSAERRAAHDDVTAAAASLADVTLLMEAAAARAWFAHKTATVAAADAAEAAGLATELVTIAENRQRLGLVAPEALNTAREQAAAAGRHARELAFARDSAARQIDYLAGSPAVTSADSDATIPDPPPVPAELPAELLIRRPDLRAAQARVAAADARLAAIHRGWLPPIALTATQGQASSSLGQLLATAGGFFGLGAVLALPVFDGGRHKARVAHSQAEKDLVEAQYRESAAAALRDVHDSLEAARTAHGALIDARTRAEADERLASLAADRATRGTTSRASVVETKLEAAQSRIESHLALGRDLATMVTLQQALGGGW